jgi:xylulokinase
LGELDTEQRTAIAGISVSGHYPTLLLADDAGRPLAPARLYGDQRADSAVDAAAQLGGEALAGDEWLPKLLHLRRTEPALLRQARMVFNPHDYVAFRLTGLRGLDHRSARRSGGLFDPPSLAWRADVCAAAGLDPRSLPPLRRAGEILGGVTPAAALETGIPVGTPVVIGLGDTPAELLGAGAVRPGDALLYYGTTTSCDVISHPFEAYLLDPAPIVDWAPYHEVAYAVIGPALPWVAAGLVPEAAGMDEAIAELDASAARLEPALEDPFVLPFFLAHARPGTPVRRPAMVGLDAGHSRANLHRAVLESFGFIVRSGLESAGLEPSQLRFVATGGGARSPFWRQLTSDVLGVAQEWRPAADAALGSAALAAWATTDAAILGPTLGDGLDTVTTTPDPAVHRLEEKRYAAWSRLLGATLGALNP